jgi:transglutaminase-like putative cysteine protease
MKFPFDKTRPVRWWDWPAVFLLIAAIYVAATRLNATKWTGELNIVQTISILGVVAGLALGMSTFSPGVVRFFGFVYGAFIIFWRLGLTLGSGVLWPERMVSMGNRLLIILDQIFQQKPVTDNLFFNLLMGTLFWILSIYAGYSLTRYGNSWRAVIPAGLTMLIIQIYDPFLPIRAWFIAGFIFLALFLVARMNFIHLNYRWKKDGTYLPPYLSLDSLRLGLITTVILVLFAWTVPAVASAVPQAEQVWLNATRPWAEIRNQLSNVFYSLQASVGVVTDFYGENLPLGRGNPLSDTTIMTIEAPPRPALNVRYYWRSRVYDTYENGWSSTSPTVNFFTPDEFNLTFPEYEDRVTSTFSVTTIFPIQNIQTPAQPVWVSRPANAYYAVNPDGSIDLSHLKADPVLMGGDTYRVEASLTTASQIDMREAGTDYPSWVTSRYLQLPDTITPRTKELAQEIASSFDNPYDITQAITNFLRTSLTYSDTVPGAPDGQEPIDWVLFDHKEAFCNYYATAEIIMLRSLGIPARLAVGYAEGERVSIGGSEDIPTLQPGGENIPQDIQIEGDLFTVRHKDAHAWPEVYFPDIGWVEFEPTASQQPIIRPIGLNLDPSEQTPPQSEFDDFQDRARQRLDELSAVNPASRDVNIAGFVFDPTPIYITIGIITVIAIIFLIRRVRIRRGSPPIAVQLESGLVRVGINSPKILQRWAYHAKLSPLSRAYLELNHALSRLGRKPVISNTPSERAQVLVQLLPLAEKPVQAVIVPYQNSMYGNQIEDTDAAQQAGKEIRKISYFAKLQRFLHRFQDPKRNHESIDTI